MADEYILRSTAIAKLTALEVTDPFATIADAKRALADMAAADVAKVVHGKWGDNGIAGSMLVKCSVCGFDCGANSFSYCPNCGARIRQAKRGKIRQAKRGKVRRKYGEILELYRYCVEAGMDVRLERLHDGWAVRFPNGGDFAQHAGTYGTHDGFVEPAIGCEADYSPVSLREAEKLICENRERLVTPSCEGERGMEGE